MIAACSLNKSFAAAGGAIVFPDAEMRRRVRTAGGPMIFSGPIQPPLLGAAIQSAKIHLSDELPVLQAALRERIELFTDARATSSASRSRRTTSRRSATSRSACRSSPTT